MSWQKQGNKGGKYIKFAAGSSFEAKYLGYEEKANPFFQTGEAVSNTNQETIIDYKFEKDGQEAILSSTAQTLKDQLLPLEANQPVRIEMVQKGIKKFFIVYIQIPDEQ